jgi:large conductance mechanosensitive channel
MTKEDFYFMKSTLQEFKDFISRGNIIDLAVGVVMGSAFTAIVTSLVNDIITPIIGAISGGVDFSGLAVHVGDATIGWGAFIQAIINFLIVAACMFAVIKALAKLKKPEEPKEEPAPVVSDEVKLLTEILEELKKQG